MYTIVAIEGIDRIGKSTFISQLQMELSKYQHLGFVTIEKPTIGINTLHKDAYPLQHIPGIMEIRNIGLFEELLFQVQQHMTHDLPSKCVIRDRFHLSELAYGMELRPEMFNKVLTTNDGYEIYSQWTRWFESQLIETGCTVKQIVFVLDDESIPNEDEAVSSSHLIPINQNFKKEYEQCTFEKKLIHLHKDGEFTNILDYVQEVILFVIGEQQFDSQLFYILDNKLCLKAPNAHFQIHDVLDGGLLTYYKWVTHYTIFTSWFEQYIKQIPNPETIVLPAKVGNIIQHVWNTIPLLIIRATDNDYAVVLHIGEKTVCIGHIKSHFDTEFDFEVNGCIKRVSIKSLGNWLVKHYDELEQFIHTGDLLTYIHNNISMMD